MNNVKKIVPSPDIKFFDAFTEEAFGDKAGEIEVKGYRILVKAVELPDITSGGIILVDSFKKAEAHTKNVGQVIQMGFQAFKPEEKFMNRPYCKVGDWIQYDIYGRKESYINGFLCFYINDDDILGVVPPECVIPASILPKNLQIKGETKDE